MITIKGKHAQALVMLPDESHLDVETRSQIQNIVNHPAIRGSQIRIMVDTHAGAGCVVGYTQTANDYVIPNLVGVDIGCGMLAYKTKLTSLDLPALDTFIRKTIPSGFDKRNRPVTQSRTNPAWDEIESVCVNTKQVTGDVLHSLGTLGGGNHFIEVDVGQDGLYWVVIHSGSRNFGLKVCNYWQGRARELMKTMFIGEAYKTVEFLPAGTGMEGYLADMKVAQSYAGLNRYYMMKDIFDYLHTNPIEQIESIHNYFNFSDKVIRKGAISAHEGERLLIPLNMRDGIILGTGKGSNKWNNSAPHGAGRILSRSKAKETLSMDVYKSSMDGIYTTCVNRHTLDESPMAYKDKQLILDNIGEITSIDEIIKPVYNFKAGEE
jgi:RNA-splicing ligase RtcB